MSALAIATAIWGFAAPYIKKAGSWILEKLAFHGVRFVSKLLNRRTKSMKRRIFRMTRRMLKKGDIQKLGSHAKRILWLSERRDTYLKLSSWLESNAKKISRSVAEKLSPLAYKEGVKRVGDIESFERWKLANDG